MASELQMNSFQEVSLDLNSENRFSGASPSLNSNSKIKFCIQFKNNNDDSLSHLNFGWHIFNSYHCQWDATNNKSEPVSAGVYLYRIEIGDFRQTKKNDISQITENSTLSKIKES